jgi:hypothetical protein
MSRRFARRRIININLGFAKIVPEELKLLKIKLVINLLDNVNVF